METEHRVAATATARDLRRSGVGRRARPADVLGPVVLAWFVLVRFDPFELSIAIHPAASAIVLPLLGALTLTVTPAERLRRAPVSLALAGSLLWSASTYLWSQDAESTLFLIRDDVVPILVVAIVSATMDPRRIARVLLGVVVVVTLWSLIVSVVSVDSRSVIVDGEEQLGFRGTFVHKNQLGIFLVLGLCLGLPYLRGAIRVPMIVVMVGGIMLTRSATAAGALLVVVAAWFGLQAVRRQRSIRDQRQFAVFIFVAVIVGAFLVAGLMPSVLGVYDKDVTLSGRTTVWEETIETIQDRPLLGHGLGGLFFAEPANEPTVELIERVGFAIPHAHSGPLQVTLEQGIVGLGLLLGFLVHVVVAGARGVARSPGEQPHAAGGNEGVWALLTVAALLVLGVAEPVLGGANLGWLAIIWSAASRSPKPEVVG